MKDFTVCPFVINADGFNTDKDNIQQNVNNFLTSLKTNLYLISSSDHKVTGVLNNETVEVMKAPRCGVSDISRYGHFQGKPRWRKRLITYR